MQRIIRTEFYVNENNEPLANPDVSIAWINGSHYDSFDHIDFSNLVFDVFPITRIGYLPIPLNSFVQRFLSSTSDLDSRPSSFMFYDFDFPYFEEQWVQSILIQEIVIENSPPISIPFQTLLHNATSIGIGSLIGDVSAGGHPSLLFLTVPAGIIIIGTATGVSEGLRKGLARRFERMLNPTKSKTREIGR